MNYCEIKVITLTCLRHCEPFCDTAKNMSRCELSCWSAWTRHVSPQQAKHSASVSQPVSQWPRAVLRQRSTQTKVLSKCTTTVWPNPPPPPWPAEGKLSHSPSKAAPQVWLITLGDQIIQRETQHDSGSVLDDRVSCFYLHFKHGGGVVNYLVIAVPLNAQRETCSLDVRWRLESLNAGGEKAFTPEDVWRWRGLSLTRKYLTSVLECRPALLPDDSG